MVINKIETSLGTVTELVADENMMIIDKERTFVFSRGFLPKGKTEDDYEEVSYDIWGLLVDNEIPKNKVEELESTIQVLSLGQAALSEVLLDTDFRLMCLEMGITP